mmetsp:Transcript_24869/g.28396  ORF Transcript_24869/g.28396 Transcript_24869/m.28396 type:complete len:225 (+) Transcript_24869:333-1007(+)
MNSVFRRICYYFFCFFFVRSKEGEGFGVYSCCCVDRTNIIIAWVFFFLYGFFFFLFGFIVFVVVVGEVTIFLVGINLHRWNPGCFPKYLRCILLHDPHSMQSRSSHRRFLLRVLFLFFRLLRSNITNSISSSISIISISIRICCINNNINISNSINSNIITYCRRSRSSARRDRFISGSSSEDACLALSSDTTTIFVVVAIIIIITITILQFPSEPSNTLHFHH